MFFKTAMYRANPTVANILIFFTVVAMSAFCQAPTSLMDDGSTANPIGTMTYLVGEVDVHRNGEFLEWEVVDIGLEIEDYDLVQTGRSGNVQVELVTPATRDATITIAENTAFYFDISKLDRSNKTTIEMLSGSIAFKVTRLVSDDTFEVRTPSIVMGVRGTELFPRLRSVAEIGFHRLVT